MKGAAFILNPKYKDQAIQTNISYDQQQGHFVAQDNLRLVKYQYCQFVDPYRAHINSPCTCYHVSQSHQN